MYRIKQVEEIFEFQFSPLAAVHINRYHGKECIHLVHAETENVHERTHKYDLQILLPAKI